MNERIIRIKISETRQRLLDYLIKNGDTNRAELVKKLKLARTTIFDNLRILEEMGLVRRYPKRIPIRGRPFTMWGLSKNE